MIGYMLYSIMDKYYKIKQPIKEKREYQKSFGGRTDCDNNSLLKIDVNLFL